MSNIGFAIDLPFTAKELPIASSLEPVRGAGFDYVVWHTTRDSDIAVVHALLKQTGLKPIAIAVPGNDFLLHPQHYQKQSAILQVPDIIMIFDDDQCFYDGTKEKLCVLSAEISEGQNFQNIRLLIMCKTLHAPEKLLEFTEQSLTTHHMLDTCTLASGANTDVAEVLRSLPDRCPLLLVEDTQAPDTTKILPLGKGSLDWNAIFDSAEEASVEWYVCRAQDLENSLSLAKKNLEFLTERA